MKRISRCGLKIDNMLGADDKRPWIALWLPLAFFAVLTHLSRHHVFFWDTVQFAGKHGLWFYEQHFQQLLLPPEIDSGHPPFFGCYMALVWSLFGKSLVVSHWAMFPFLVGTLWQLFLMGQHLLKNSPAIWLILIPLADPVFLGQSILAGPDLILAFFFLLGLRAYRNNAPLWSAVAYLGMSMISMRGMMVTAAFAFLLIWQWLVAMSKTKERSFPAQLLLFLPAGLFSLAFLAAHYRAYGWIGYHADSPWAPSFDRVGLSGLLRNFTIFGWRWLDFGRVFIWATLFVLLVIDRIKTGRTLRSYYLRIKTSSVSDLLLLLFLICLLFSYSFLTYEGLQAHRYLLPAFLLFSIIVVVTIDRFLRSGVRRVLFPVLLVGILSGNLWKYPDGIAQGWDSTMAHWPYYQLRADLLEYIEQEDIALDSVGTAFPEIGPLDWRDLSGRKEGFKEKDLTQDRYILYSNVMNDFSDAERQELKTHWTEIKKLEAWPVTFILYKRERE